MIQPFSFQTVAIKMSPTKRRESRLVTNKTVALISEDGHSRPDYDSLNRKPPSNGPGRLTAF